jgi:thiamine biosynthesis lipoprotein
MARLVAPTMGTTVTIDVRDREIGPDVLEGAVDVLRELEARFSTYRPDSEICRIDRGELTPADAHPDVREVLQVCAVLQVESGGAFDAWRDGRLDPSGYVKGWAAERAADVLRAAGARNFGMNVGGDVICSGERSPGEAWRVGIRHPDDPERLILAVGVRDGAVATSGLYERGAHVTDARSGASPTAWTSVTVIARDLGMADAIATAALAMGDRGPAWAAARIGCEVAALDAGGRLMTSAGIDRLRVA